jgi:Zn-finger nucleic acid-binding protein
MPFSSRAPLTVPGKPFRLECPKCDAAMDHRTSKERGDDFGVDVCGACGVMWFDPEELKRVMACEATAAEIDDHKDVRERRIAIFRGKVMKCPRDGEKLIVREHMEKPDVDVDQCPACRGILLDPGELRQLAERSWREKLREWWGGK